MTSICSLSTCILPSRHTYEECAPLSYNQEPKKLFNVLRNLPYYQQSIMSPYTFINLNPTEPNQYLIKFKNLNSNCFHFNNNTGQAMKAHEILLSSSQLHTSTHSTDSFNPSIFIYFFSSLFLSPPVLYCIDIGNWNLPKNVHNFFLHPHTHTLCAENEAYFNFFSGYILLW